MTCIVIFFFGSSTYIVIDQTLATDIMLKALYHASIMHFCELKVLPSLFIISSQLKAFMVVVMASQLYASKQLHSESVHLPVILKQSILTV
jgi:hypothetical protein